MIARKIVFVLTLTCLLLVGASAALAAQTPMERVKEGAGKLIKILSDPSMTEPAHHDQAIKDLRATAEQYIDFRLVTMFAVGRPWLKMTPQMQNDLVEAFVQLLERSYLQKIPAYGGQEVDYVKEQVKGNKARVVAEIIDKDKKIVVEFRLKIVHEQWMIYDVVAEGVSLVANYRSQFSQVLNDGTPEELLDLIRKRIKKLDEKGDGEDAGKIQG